LKEHFVRRALTDRPELANYARFPAVNWFSPYQLKRVLNDAGVDTMDRFDLVDIEGQSALAQLIVKAATVLPPVRFVGHVLSVSSIVLGRRREAA
jgi:2-polyprenyl-6-hydroxyphenyl methylase/3-demethylubiquinone-9 3-methyltransferase